MLKFVDRYCNVGCGALDMSNSVFPECCTPLAAGATAPPDCSSVMSSRSAEGTTCPYPTDIGTTDFPDTYSYQPTSSIPQSQAGQSAVASESPVPDGGCASTVWVTSTTTTECSTSCATSEAYSSAAISETSSIDQGMSGIGASASTSSNPPPAPSPTSPPPASSATSEVVVNPSCTPCALSSIPLVQPSEGCLGDSCPSQG
ncbi:hypothetical protein BD324DRAFT_4495 [Kockovaella imperatae]|uniref:Uncharacterized protein n=1 Tax=Kockovaella imperatae TaxID=4999 RepID=A0A1Y1UR24_9TREE|nr:hypothetical protein BD324DRAFT_4495 [Kockovaella imperatae]ORX40503.1 hypothetical protein BD324DRAFT_4495 [Kockovaella imperatae]